VASSTDAKLASLVVTADDSLDVGVEPVLEFALAALPIALGSAIVVRPIAIPPMSNSTAAAACTHGWRETQPREDV
jgi:hypothetical protein